MQIKRTARTLLAAAALTGAALIAAPTPQAHAAVFISVGFAPPAIPVYAQPIMPGDGYVWTPGYWAYGPDGYYWVDGAWVLPPYDGALWTPGWWGFDNDAYVWYPGYWGTTVGYYGGINYGFGYFGTGFVGGYWNGGHFFYNREYNHFGGNFHGNVYDRTYAGFNGRPGGNSFVAHPPAQYTAHYAGSEVNGRGIHGTEAFPNRGDNGFANRQQQPNSYQNSERGQQNTQQNNWNRGAQQQGFAQAQNNSNRAPQQTFDSGQQQRGFADRGAANNVNRGTQNFDNHGGQNFENRGAQNFDNRGAQPAFNRAPAAPAAPAANFNRGGSAPAPHYSAPSGGAEHGGGNSSTGSRGGGGGHR